jgi:uncharacterized protein (DUF58 family)
MPVPTRRLAALFVLSAVALAFSASPQPETWLVVIALLAGLTIVDFALAVRPRTIDVRRDVPVVIALGAAATIRWSLRNPTQRPAVVMFADELAPSLGAPHRRLRVRLPRRSTATVALELRPVRRGEFLVDELALRIEGPLGLVARQRTRHLPMSIRVFPSFRSKDEAELRINKARILETGLRSAKGRGGGTEFDQLRDYTVDDDFRRVDWAATARAGRAFVRTYRAERNQTVINLLDNGRVMAGTVDNVARIEHAMDAVMTLTTVATRLGDRCGLLAFDQDVRAVVSASNARSQLGRVVDAMFDLEPVFAESDYRGAFNETLVRFRRRAMLVIYTELVEQAVGESLLPALGLIARHHVVVIAAVQDPAVVGWAGGRATTDEDVYRKVAAIGALEERRRTVARLQRLGATVIDAPPRSLPLELADAYLRVKATGRL